MKDQDRNPSKDISAAAMMNKLDVGKEIKAMHIAERLGESCRGAVAAAPDIVDHAKSYALPEPGPAPDARTADQTRRRRR